MSEPLNILLVEDSADDATLLDAELARAGMAALVTRVETEIAYRSQLEKGVDVVLSDFNLPAFSTSRALAVLREVRMEIPFVVVSGTIGEERAVQLVKDGASDYVLKEHLFRLPGVIARVLAEYHERSERRRIEAQLQIHVSALEAAANGILITDRTGKILSANRAVGHLTGYEPDELIGQNVRLFKSDEHDAAFFREMWLTIEQGRPWQGQLTNRRQDGSLYREEMTITPLRDLAGEITHFIAVKQDITERLKLEEQLRQSQKMESIGLLAGGVAHDFNNLLTVIQGHSSLLSGDEQLPADLQDSVKEISMAAEQASRLTRQLLAFSRKQVFQMRSLDVGEIVSAIANLLDRLLGDNLTLQLKVAPGLWRIRADLGMMEQLLMNLAINARDAMPEGGLLVIRATNESIDEEYARINPQANSGNHVCISVSDTGCGIPPEMRERVFEPFFTTKAVGKGTGLGLGTVYGIVRQHRGWIKLYSEVGRGTVFRVYLPAEESAPEAETPRTSVLTAKGGSETILVVEDEPALRSLVRSVLERFGFKVIEAVTGVAAYRIWQQRAGEIQLLLTDVVMPDRLSGLALAQKLREERPDLPVIFTSGYSTEIVSQGLELKEGMNFLQKPYPVMQLVKTVRAALDQLNPPRPEATAPG